MESHRNAQEPMLGQRLRDGHVGPGGYVDMLTNDTEGAMLKLEPAD